MATVSFFLPELQLTPVLVDGGYMDNTPIGPLRASGIRDIIVVDVGSIDDTSARNYGDSVSGWWLFLNRFNPFYKGMVPSMTEISSRLTYVSSVKTLEDVKSDPHCRYMTMPVQHIETIGGFKKFSEVRDIGLSAARQQLKEWAAEDRLPRGLVDDKKQTALKRRGSRVRWVRVSDIANPQPLVDLSDYFTSLISTLDVHTLLPVQHAYRILNNDY